MSAIAILATATIALIVVIRAGLSQHHKDWARGQRLAGRRHV